MTQSEKLENAGILRLEATPQDYKDAIDNHLTDAEVQSLIDIKNKLELHSGLDDVPAAAFECV